MGRVENPVNRHGQLDGAEVRPEMTTCACHRVNEKVADLRRQCGKIVDCEFLQIVRIADGRQKRHRHFLSVHSLPPLLGGSTPDAAQSTQVRGSVGVTDWTCEHVPNRLQGDRSALTMRRLPQGIRAVRRCRSVLAPLPPGVSTTMRRRVHRDKTVSRAAAVTPRIRRVRSSGTGRTPAARPASNPP